MKEVLTQGHEFSFLSSRLNTYVQVFTQLQNLRLEVSLRKIAKPVADVVKFAKIAQNRRCYVNLCIYVSILYIFKLSPKVLFQRVTKLS